MLDLHVRQIVGFILLIPLLILLSSYVWFSVEEILVSWRNYNFSRARDCNPKSCGLYHYIEGEPMTTDCLSPFVSKSKFELLRFNNGIGKGCRRSIQLQEAIIDRRPAYAYKKDFLDTYNAFHISRVWWRFLLILVGIILYVFGLFNYEDYIDTFIKIP